MRDRESISTGDIDQLLTDFFRDAQPKPWPRIAPPESTPREVAAPIIAMKKRSASPGRFALAVSVAFLAVTGIWLAGLAPTPSTGPGVNLDIGTANRSPRGAAAMEANDDTGRRMHDAPEPNTVKPLKKQKE